MNIDWGKTARGFVVGNFTDRYGVKCSIQESSLASEAAIWLGPDEPRLYYVLPNGQACDFKLPDGAECVGRMHLTQEQVAHLIPLLQYFVKHGKLPEGGGTRIEEQKAADLEVLHKFDPEKESA